MVLGIRAAGRGPSEGTQHLRAAPVPLPNCSKASQQLRDHQLMNCRKRCVCESPQPGWVRTLPALYLGAITLPEHVNH